MPDVAPVSLDKLSAGSYAGYLDAVPELVVEVVSPADTSRNISVKLARYLREGVWVWMAYPDDQDIYRRWRCVAGISCRPD